MALYSKAGDLFLCMLAVCCNRTWKPCSFESLSPASQLIQEVLVLQVR